MRTLFALLPLLLSFAMKSANAQTDSITYAIAYLDHGKADPISYQLLFDNEQSENLGTVFKLKRPWHEFQEKKATMELKLLVYMKKKGFELVTNTTQTRCAGSAITGGPYRYEWTFKRLIVR